MFYDPFFLYLRSTLPPRAQAVSDKHDWENEFKKTCDIFEGRGRALQEIFSKMDHETRAISPLVLKKIMDKFRLQLHDLSDFLFFPKDVVFLKKFNVENPKFSSDLARMVFAKLNTTESRCVKNPTVLFKLFPKLETEFSKKNHTNLAKLPDTSRALNVSDFLFHDLENYYLISDGFHNLQCPFFKKVKGELKTEEEFEDESNIKIFGDFKKREMPLEIGVAMPPGAN